jgi:PhzF family phenazine biosynthesis protein
VRAFRQVDVFSAEPLRGNPVAVVHDAEGLDDETMAAFAHWTNLSETTFLLPPTDAGRDGGADYRLRIFTPGAELPFAGHPTLGSAHAWLEAGGTPREGDTLVQECGAGLVRLRRDAESGRLAFAAPPLLRSGPVSDADLDRVTAALRISREDVVDAAWVDNGPGWVGVRLADAAAVLAVEPDWSVFGDLDVGVVGVYPEGECAVEVRAFCPGIGVVEDPVTGSLNAGLAQWLTAGEHPVLPASYVASQGTALGRRGRVHVGREGQTVWVGGDTRTTVVGSVDLGD